MSELHQADSVIKYLQFVTFCSVQHFNNWTVYLIQKTVMKVLRTTYCEKLTEFSTLDCFLHTQSLI